MADRHSFQPVVLGSGTTPVCVREGSGGYKQWAHTSGRWVASQTLKVADHWDKQRQMYVDYPRHVFTLGPRPSLDAAEVEAVVSRRLEHGTLTGGTQCMFTALPDEILVRIFEYAVPTGLIVHVFPRGTNGKGTVVHIFGAGKRSRTVPPASGAVASVCQRFADLYYSLMYGGNRWVFEMAMNPTAARFEGASLHELESWSRYYDTLHWDSGPLSARSAKYIKHLTILMTLEFNNYKGGYNKLHIKALTARLDRVLAYFEEYSGLKSFNMHVNGMHMCSKLPRDGRYGFPIYWTRHEDGEYAFKWEHKLERQEHPYWQNDEEDIEAAKPVWESLGHLNNVTEVRLNGVISPEMAEEWSARVRRPKSAVRKTTKKRRRLR